MVVLAYSMFVYSEFTYFIVVLHLVSGIVTPVLIKTHESSDLGSPNTDGHSIVRAPPGITSSASFRNRIATPRTQHRDLLTNQSESNKIIKPLAHTVSPSN